MGLKKLKEPIELKTLIQKIRTELGSDNDLDKDTIAVWSFNKLPKYFWDNWKGELNEKDVNWQLFLKILKMHTDDFIKWAIYGSMDWDEVVERVSSTVEHYSNKR